MGVNALGASQGGPSTGRLFCAYSVAGIDSRVFPASRFRPVMRRLFPFIACLLAVLWLPATVHCGLEMAGLLAHEHGVETADIGCAESCETDSCSGVEDGEFKNASDLLKIAAPTLSVCALHLISALAESAVVEMPAVSPDKTDSPPELARTWQFTARMALLPGAPARLV
jgi:hypothetical protein